MSKRIGCSAGTAVILHHAMDESGTPTLSMVTAPGNVTEIRTIEQALAIADALREWAASGIIGEPSVAVWEP